MGLQIWQEDNFVSLIAKEIITINEFFEHQKSKIIWLKDNGCIGIDSTNGKIKLDSEKVFILKQLYYAQVGCTYYMGDFNDALNEMHARGEIEYETTLFSKPEQSYLNYMLNRSEFSNGLDLRNKYVHGSYSMDEAVHQNDYIELLKIMTLIIIKINDEFCFITDNPIGEAPQQGSNPFLSAKKPRNI